jgi:hypothetical protein
MQAICCRPRDVLRRPNHRKLKADTAELLRSAMAP